MGFFIRYEYIRSSFFLFFQISFWESGLNPFRAPKPLPILKPSNYVPQNGFPVVKGLSSQIEEPQKKQWLVNLYRSTRPRETASVVTNYET